MRKSWILVFQFIIIVFLSFAIISCTDDDSESGTGPYDFTEINIGVLVPVTGDLASFGESSRVAAELAADDINVDFASAGIKFRVNPLILDTESNPEAALILLKVLKKLDCRIVTGLISSAELEEMKDYADANDIVIISQASTAPDLSIPNDNIYRLVTDDTYQAETVAEVMWDDGIQAAAVFYRDDNWGDNLADCFTASFQSLGGSVIERRAYNCWKSINYIDSLNIVSPAVENAISTYGDSAVAMQLISFDEGRDILNAASAYTPLSSVNWYGSDGFCQSSYLFTDPVAADFAIDRNLICPVYGEYDSPEYAATAQRIEDITGVHPISYALLGYDALNIAARTLAEVDSAATIDELKAEMMNVIANYDGVSGDIILNANGDRENGMYDFWGVEEQLGEYVWVKRFSQ